MTAPHDHHAAIPCGWSMTQRREGGLVQAESQSEQRMLMSQKGRILGDHLWQMRTNMDW